MTKPKFDLTDPALKAVIKLYGQRALLADKLAMAKDNAVRPIYALDPCTQFVEHVGSCVLLKVQDQFFALSASHVFDSVGGYQLFFGHGDRLHSFAGDRFSTGKGPSGTHKDDPIDASVFYITADVGEEVASSFLTLHDLDIVPADRKPEFYVATGYRASKSRSNSRGHSTKLDRYPTMELDDDHYERLKLSRDFQLLLSFEDQALVDGKWQMSPSVRGFSGGAMFRIPKLSPLPSATAIGYSGLKLAAILIEHRKGVRDQFHSGVVGTRLDVHFRLIQEFLPELHFGEMLAAEQARQISAAN